MIKNDAGRPEISRNIDLSIFGEAAHVVFTRFDLVGQVVVNPGEPNLSELIIRNNFILSIVVLE